MGGLCEKSELRITTIAVFHRNDTPYAGARSQPQGDPVMFNSKHSNRYFAASVVVSLAASVLVVMASLVGALDRMQAFV
jgi:hypothetical protein